MWKSFFCDGGWGMYPTSVFGLCLVASAALLVLRPERRYLLLATALSLLTLGSGVLGTLVGFVNSMHYLVEVEDKSKQLEILALGLGESLNVTILSLIIFEFAAMLMCIAALRASQRDLGKD
jgi:Na+/H+ antiporter NhaA